MIDWTNISIRSWRYFETKQELNAAIKKHYEVIDEQTDPYGTYTVTLKNKKNGNYSQFTVRKQNAFYKFLDNSHKKYVY
jgi:hypothetical protein